MSTPVRTCVGCRQRDAQPALVRIALAAGHVVPDPARRRPGRGAYVHQRTECVERALRGGLARGLRAQVGSEGAAAVRRLLAGEAESI